MLNRTQLAANHVGKAIQRLKQAKCDLLAVGSNQHLPVAMQLAALEEIFATLTDPDCTPEIMEGR